MTPLAENRSTPSILVADDEADLLSEVTGYLRRRGQTVIEANSFGEAMRAYTDNANSIALVVTDINMPDGDGADLARFVIQSSQGTCSCLLMTGHFHPDCLTPDLRAAGVRVLDKPFGLSVLYASVLNTLATTDRGEQPYDA
jgi:DNA-binding NtrC family response regulator